MLGDLTASESFQEVNLFVHNDLFRVLLIVLCSPVLATLGPINANSDKGKESNNPTKLSRVKFFETIVWTVANAIADDKKCQSIFL